MKFGRIQVLNWRNREDGIEAIRAIGADEPGWHLMAPKGIHRVLKVKDVSTRAANILKQEMLSRGGEVAVHKQVCNFGIDKSDVIMMGTLRQFQLLIKKLRVQPFGLKSLADQLAAALTHLEGRKPSQLDCRGKILPLGERTLVMGILNVTPDSFSDGGRYLDPAVAVERARQMVEEGADVIDLGGESTRPGYTPISAEEEIDRLLPVVKALVEEFPVPLSIDTYKAAVAEKCLGAGAHLINDIWGLQKDPDMAEVVASYGAPVILMHNQENTEYGDLLSDMQVYLGRSMELALEAGIPEDKLILDPGIGFGKTHEQNLEVMARLDELASLGRPLLLGTSRKSLIAKTLDVPAEERVEGTAATVAVGIAKGIDLVRVHDVKEMVRVARMTDAMVRRKGGSHEG